MNGLAIGFNHDWPVLKEPHPSQMRVTALVLLSMLSLTVRATAQEARNLLDDTAIADDKNVTGYFHFSAFLDLAFDAFKEGPEAFYFTILRKMGIAPETPGAEAIEDAAMEAHLLAGEILALGPYAHDTEAFYRAQAASQRMHVKRMAAIYQSMMIRLKASGTEYSTLWDFIQQEVAPGTGVYSTEPHSRASEELFAIVKQEFRVVPSKPMAVVQE